MRRARRATVALLMAGGAVATSVGASAAVRSITTLSPSSDRVSGGDVLIEVRQDDDAPTRVTLNGSDVTGAFHLARQDRRCGASCRVRPSATAANL